MTRVLSREQGAVLHESLETRLGRRLSADDLKVVEEIEGFGWTLKKIADRHVLAERREGGDEHNVTRIASHSLATLARNVASRPPRQQRRSCE